MPDPGGVGNSWLLVELTSDPLPYLGGVGFSWFEISLTSDDVPDIPDEPPPIEPPHRGSLVSPAPRRRKQHFEQRFAGSYSVVKSQKDRFGGRLIIFKPSSFAGVFDVVESSSQSFSASYNSSILRARQREEEEFLFLIDDE